MGHPVVLNCPKNLQAPLGHPVQRRSPAGAPFPPGAPVKISATDLPEIPSRSQMKVCYR